MACTPLTFHPQCGKNVRVIEGGMKVERISGLGRGSALTARPLRTEEIFTLQLSGRPQLYFGVTTHSPENLMVFPVFMYDIEETWCLGCLEEGKIFVNGDVVNNQFLSIAALAVLKEGDTLGLQVTKTRKLRFSVNGKEVGVAATDMPNTVYGFVDLYSSRSRAVNLIHGVHEMEGTPTTALPQGTPPQKKEKEEKMAEKEHTQLESSAMREIAYSELEFEESLGIGGQGVVFKAQWKARNLTVAIKRVTGKIRYEEAGLLSKLSHPNVITFYGICAEKYPEYFIITELAEGGALYNLIHEKHYHPNLEESLRWAKEIAEGMCYLHQQKVIHRDLKSHNVLLTASMTIKICDFGSAKEFDHTTKQTGTGTYRWIAPEVLKGERVSLACDVYSYGMVLFEVFKQEIPFANIHDIKVISMISEGKTPTIPISLKPYLANLMKCCWQMNPKSRPSFQEILTILETKECQEPVSGSLEAAQDTIDGGPGDVRLTPKHLPHLQTVLDEASGVWFPLGMKLKLDTRTLTGIATASGNDNSTALSFMLTRWLKSKNELPLLQSLTDALSSPDIELTHLSVTLLKDKDQFEH